MLSCVALGMSFGVAEVLMPAFGEAHGSRAQGGFALAAFALGSLIGGLWIGTRPPARQLGMRFAVSLGALALALLPPLVAPSLPVMCAAHADRRHADRAGLRRLLRSRRRARCARDDDRGVLMADDGDRRRAGVGTSAGGAAIDPLGITGALALAAPCAGVAALVAFVRHGSLTAAEPVP